MRSRPHHRHRLLFPRFRRRHFQTLPDASRPCRSYECSCGSSEPTPGAVSRGRCGKPCLPIRLPPPQSQPPWRSPSRQHPRASTIASIVPLSACPRSIPPRTSPTPAPSSRRLRTRIRRKNAVRCFQADTRTRAPHTTSPSPTPASRSPTWPARTPATSRRAPPPCRIRRRRPATPAPLRPPWPTLTRTPRLPRRLACRAGEEPRWTTRGAPRSHPIEGTRVEALHEREPRCRTPWTRKEPPR
mmetsp:Transcript_725/g.3314  ORF Transcript_725/g.3314 Transcript_725/m.3314 type:complete len:243 (-) Transcript_725:1186-1914(-)